MKIKIGTETVIETNMGMVTLSNVYSGVGIETDKGLFGIAQRDDGIEVMLDGKTVWTSHDIGMRSDDFIVDTPEAAFRRGQEAARTSIINMIEDPGRWRAGALSSTLVSSVIEVATQSGYKPPLQPEPTWVEKCKKQIQTLPPEKRDKAYRLIELLVAEL